MFETTWAQPLKARMTQASKRLEMAPSSQPPAWGLHIEGKHWTKERKLTTHCPLEGLGEWRQQVLNTQLGAKFIVSSLLNPHMSCSIVPLLSLFYRCQNWGSETPVAYSRAHSQVQCSWDTCPWALRRRRCLCLYILVSLQSYGYIYLTLTLWRVIDKSWGSNSCLHPLLYFSDGGVGSSGASWERQVRG